MAFVVILISAVLMEDLATEMPSQAETGHLVEVLRKFDATPNFDANIPNPESLGGVFLTLETTGDPHALAEALQGLDGVISAYAKPAEELP